MNWTFTALSTLPVATCIDMSGFEEESGVPCNNTEGQTLRLTQIDRRRAQVDGFFDEVYKIVARIPAGKVATYGQIAAMLASPHAARTVGWAMASAPSRLNLPCHRVVNKVGRLAPDPVFGGYDAQRAELEAEGVVFRKDGRIDMRKCLWRPAPDELSD